MKPTATQAFSRTRPGRVAVLVLALTAGVGCEPPGAAQQSRALPWVGVERAAHVGDGYVMAEPSNGSLTLAEDGVLAPLVVSAGDWPGVLRVAGQLRSDIQRVTGSEPPLYEDEVPAGAREVVLLGTLGRHALIDELVESGKLDVTQVSGRWETFVAELIEAPLPDVERAFVIAGSDKRGTIYGIYDLSAHVGISPWHFWADVPPNQVPNLYVFPGRYTQGTPSVKYRGLFIGNESPALLGWANDTYGGLGAEFYERVFELMSRLRANLLWPAREQNAFHADDEENARLADEYGIVVGTSGREPMLRAAREWTDAGYTGEQWDYETNAAGLRSFWEGGVERSGGRESVVTLGMSGYGGEPLANATGELVERIIDDQRSILEAVTSEPADTIPQLLELSEPIQSLYDGGLEVPEDVTLLFTDDGWGSVRRVPDATTPARAGGYGLFYHFDFAGEPRSYKWLDTNPIPRVWQQLHLAYASGIDRMFVVNAGDLKPLEFPLEFFFDYAWSPETWPSERLREYTELWAARTFGREHAPEIADIVVKYTKYNGRRKPELLEPTTYSLVNFREAERVVTEFTTLAERAQTISDSLPVEMRDAFYQLVLYPTAASANVTDLYVTAGRNALYATQGRAATNDLALRVQELFERDAELTRYYQETVAGGKWNRMLDQPHIGYTTWEQPAANRMPAVEELTLPEPAALGVWVEGSEGALPASGESSVLPELSPFLPPGSTRCIEVFNRGQTPFEFTASAVDAPWLTITPASGTVTKETRLEVGVYSERAPFGSFEVPISIRGSEGTSVVVTARVHNPETPRPETVTGFVETDGIVSLEAQHSSRAIAAGGVRWKLIPELGRTLSGVTPFPVTAASQTPGGESARLEYDVHLFSSGTVRVHAYLSPSAPIHGSGLRYAVSFDDREPLVVDLHAGASSELWQRQVSDAVDVSTTQHELSAPGPHTLKFWMVDPGVVLQKLVIDAGTLRTSYLGPPASVRFPAGDGGSSGSGGASGTAAGSPGATAGSSSGAAPPMNDAGATIEGGGCSCRTTPERRASFLAPWWLGLAALVLCKRRQARPC